MKTIETHSRDERFASSSRPNIARTRVCRLANERPLDEWIAAVCRYSAYAMFFLILFAPSGYLTLKSWLLGVAVVPCALRACLRKNVGLKPDVAAIFLTFLAAGFLFTGLGAARNTAGWFREGEVFVVYPAIYMVLIAGGLDRSVVRDLLRIMVAALIAIGVYFVIHVLHYLGYYPSSLFIDLTDQDIETVGLRDGYSRCSLMSVTSLVFLLPFALSALVLWKDDRTAPVRRKTLWLAILLGIAAAMLSGRRGLWLTSLAAPLIIFVGMRLYSGKKAAARVGHLAWVSALFFVCSVAVMVVFSWHTDVTYEGLCRAASTVVEDLTGNSSDIRTEQAHELIRAWRERPFLGHGFGNGLPNMVRNENAPWSYELSYHSLLFRTGLIGMAVYGGIVFWIYRTGGRIVRCDEELGAWIFPLLVGLTCFLVANAFDPYLERFESMWTMFLPIGIINCWERSVPRPAPTTPSRGRNVASRRGLRTR